MPTNWLLYGWRAAEDDDRLESARRRTAQFLLPMGAAATLVKWLFELTAASGAATATAFDRVAYPLIAAYLLTLAIMLWRGRPAVCRFDRAALIGATAFIMGKLIFLYAIVIGGGISAAAIHDEVLELAVWLPVFHVALFVVLDGRKGLAASLATFVPAVGLLLFATGGRTAALSHMAGLAFANAMLIGLVYVLARFRDEHGLAQAVAMRMAHLANTDHLTGVPNRRGLADLLGREIAASVRYDRPLSIILFDPDRFKRVNDRYGHDTGDQILREMATLVGRHLRKSDHFGRWGGEEFLILAPETRGEAASRMAERLRLLVAGHRFAGPGGMTASFGVTQLHPSDTIDQLLKRADEALYEAKASGRDRVVLNTPERRGHDREERIGSSSVFGS